MITKNNLCYYTFDDLKQKFNWHTSLNKIQDQIIYAQKRGVSIRVAFKQGRTHFEIMEIDDSLLLEWKICPTHPELEVCENGQVRNATTKKIYSSAPDKDGYLRITLGHQRLTIHRLLMETFCPNANCANLWVDHINGIRTDNTLQNLRWVTPEENRQLRYQNQNQIQECVALGIQKLGYAQFAQILSEFVTTL